MQQPLPTGLMRFIDEEELKRFDPQKITYLSELGYICEVDLEYPTNLHDSHNCYPLAPEHKQMDEEDVCITFQSESLERTSRRKN